MNPVNVKKMVDGHKEQRERELAEIARAKREADAAWEEYEKTLNKDSYSLDF